MNCIEDILRSLFANKSRGALEQLLTCRYQKAYEIASGANEVFLSEYIRLISLITCEVDENYKKTTDSLIIKQIIKDVNSRRTNAMLRDEPFSVENVHTLLSQIKEFGGVHQLMNAAIALKKQEVPR